MPAPGSDETHLRQRLRTRHALWLHGACIGLLTLGAMWAASALQMALGVNTLALRYAISLGAGYLAYLLILRLWAGWLVEPEKRDERAADALEALSHVPPPGAHPAHQESPCFASGGGGDFGGAGAQGAFPLSDAPQPPGGDTATSMLQSAGDALGGADEGAIVIVPVLAVFGTVAAVLLGGGSLLWLAFGWEALLTVAVEVAFAYTAARTAVRMRRQGWLWAAVRLSWKPLLATLACAVAAGALLDHLAPDARSLPQALRQWRAASR
ncbi:hypothetical protein EII20_13100 [Comamonadaceae bacterium OH2545_COT-014]|nr:hypothetical protein EII20_13100 [Comamonadaceae bacterium OH2545_COT-014]